MASISTGDENRDRGELLSAASSCYRFVAAQQNREKPNKSPSDLQNHLKVGDCVIGVVTRRTSEQFNVDIGLDKDCALPTLSFESATKRNIPDIYPRDLVYARIHSNTPNCEIILTCVNKNNKSNGLGKLSEDGYLIQVSTDCCKKLMSSASGVLKDLSKYLKYEVAMSANGFIWIRSENSTNMLLVANIFLAFDDLKEHPAEFSKKLMKMFEQ